MALTQSARLIVPSWDDEVVPALRKRLESESRTLAHRMSAISLSSLDEQQNANYSGYSDKTVRQNQPAAPSQQSSSSRAQRLQSIHQPPRDRKPTTVSPRINGANHVSSKSTSQTEFQRARTYSSPYASDLPNGKGRRKNSAANSEEPIRSISPRTVDVKPTRIPKAASRPPISLPTSATNSPRTNGYSHSAVVTSSSQSPELPYQTSADQGAPQGGAMPYSPTSSTVELSNRGNGTSGLLNESPPFPASPTMSSEFSQQEHGEDPPRPSIDSEERPYEHWYRGEVSRNGGVGELRVGKRQEMLDIANYGHLIESKKKALKSRIPAAEDTPRQRRRAGSISGITNMERERGSLYLDEEHANEVGRVLDEHPLTDLDGEGSDTHSASSDNQEETYAYLPGIGEAYSTTESTTTAGAHEIRSTTPTPSNIYHRPSSRQQQNLPPTRIPGPSSRRSSESRSTTTTTSPQPGSMARGASEPTQAFSTASKTPSPPPAPSSSSNARQQYSSNTVSTPAQKRGASPASKKAKTAAKANRVKTLQGKKEGAANRGSVAYYPTPYGDEEDMADAIPSWTQPVHREGNWDDVVLPVVARKKGLDGHYEDANGSPQPKKIEDTVEPAPGTFGFDKSKYRPPRMDMDSMPMDEFGRPEDQKQFMDQDQKLAIGLSPMQEGRRPFRNPPSPSPAPFSQYAPTSVKVLGKQDIDTQKFQPRPVEDDDKGAGCCKCVIM